LTEGNKFLSFATVGFLVQVRSGGVWDRQLCVLLVSLSAGVAASGALAAWQVALAVWLPLAAAWLVWCGFLVKEK
jgi:uncharacterized membrane protein YoaK (UPF0700 family)